MAILKWIYFVVLFEHLLSGIAADQEFAFPNSEENEVAGR